MRKSLIAFVFLSVVFLQGCKTIPQPACIEYPDSATCIQQNEDNTRNPIKKFDNWIQKHLW